MCRLMAAFVPHRPNKYFHVTASNGTVSNSPYTLLAIVTASQSHRFGYSKPSTVAWLLSISAAKSPIVAATSPNLGTQLEPLASDLDIVRRSVGQLVAKQEQMAQNIAALQAVEEDIRQKMSFTPPSSPAPVQQAAPILPHRTPRPTIQPAQSSSVSSPPPPAGQVSVPRSPLS